MKERIKILRKHLGLTMEEFGKHLGVTKSAISNIENGNRRVTEQMLKSVCREFGVNENWMRNGVGNAFINKQSDFINGLSQFYDLDDLSRSMLEEYLKLSADHKDVIKNYILSIADNLSSKK